MNLNSDTKPPADDTPHRRAPCVVAADVITIGAIMMLPPGKHRRAHILSYLQGDNNPQGKAGITVNRRRCLPESDPDLQRLLKKGLIERCRHGAPRSRLTYFVSAFVAPADTVNAAGLHL